MTPDRLRGWLRKPAHGAKRVQLSVESSAGTLQPIADWTREDIDAQATGPQPEAEPETQDADIAAELLAQCQEYTNSLEEKQRFTIAWMGKGDRVLRSITHLCKPTLEGDDGVSATISDATIIRELLTSLNNKDKRIDEILSTFTNAYKATIEMKSASEDELSKRLVAARKKLPDATEVTAEIVPRELTPEEAEESRRRAAALQTLTDKLPEFFDLAIAALAQRFLNNDEEKGEAAE